MPVDIRQLLDFVVSKNGSDLHLSVGRPPVMRVKGRMRELKMDALTAGDTAAVMAAITPDTYRQEFERDGGADFGFAFGDKARFRVSLFRQKGVTGLVLRQLPGELPGFEALGLPPIVQQLCRRPRGLVLVTGPTGSGKTTTLATMVDWINRETDRHIVTIEDPVEYHHEHGKGLITQREIGRDVPTFAEGLRRALRMDPDVILVGEMRDLDTISAAITAAETGHLVLGTLHTTGAARTVDRVIDVYPREQQAMVRVQLSVSLVGVISQQLLPRADGSGRIAAFEIMITTDAVANLIRERKTYQLPSAMQTGSRHGMILLDEHLFRLTQQGLITEAAGLERADDPDELRRRFAAIDSPDIRRR